MVRCAAGGDGPRAPEEGSYGVWADEPSSLVAHRGYLLGWAGGGGALLTEAYLRPDAQRRLAPPPLGVNASAAPAPT